MVSESLYRRLVPGAPLHRRTDRDPLGAVARDRAESLRSATPPSPGLTDPRLHSTWQGRIEQILFAFPAWAVEDPESATAYRSVIAALRPGTEFVVVHAASARDTVEEWFARPATPTPSRTCRCPTTSASPTGPRTPTSRSPTPSTTPGT